MKTIIHAKRVCRRAPIIAVSHLLNATVLIFFGTDRAFAGSVTWSAFPVNGNWNSGLNWSPMTVPNGPSGTAIFDSSSISDLSISADIEVNGIVFTPLARPSHYTIIAGPILTLTISGVGITNNSGVARSSSLQFMDPILEQFHSGTMRPQGA